MKLNLILGLQVLNHSDQLQFMYLLQMLRCMVFIIFSPDIIQLRDTPVQRHSLTGQGYWEKVLSLVKSFEDSLGVWPF